MEKYLQFPQAQIHRGFFARFERYNGQSYPVHGHANFTEIQMVLRGRGRHRIDGKAYAAQAGDLWVLSGKTLHSWDSTRSLALYNLMFDPDWLKRRLPLRLRSYNFKERFGLKRPDALHFRLGPADLETAGTYFRKMRRESGYDTPVREADVRAAFFALVGLLTQLPAIRAAKGKGVEKAMRRLETENPRAVSNVRLALIAGLSKAQFHRRFQAQFGLSPRQYLLKLRLELAGRLLGDKSLTIKDVAAECGFVDNNYFARRFKAMYGTSPSRWRKIV